MIEMFDLLCNEMDFAMFAMGLFLLGTVIGSLISRLINRKRR